MHNLFGYKKKHYTARQRSNYSRSRDLSPAIEKAIVYLKDTVLDKKIPEVRFPIGNNREYKVFIHIFDGPDPLYYRLCIQKTNSDEIIAELRDEKHHIHTFSMEAKKRTTTIAEKSNKPKCEMMYTSFFRSTRNQ